MKEKSFDLKLPKEQTLEGASMAEMIWIIYGPPGIGKSSFIAQCEGMLFLSTDPGLRFIKAYKQTVNDWLHFKKIVATLEVDRPSRYKAIGIDTIDPLFVMCQQYVLKKRGIEHPSDEPYGKGYELVRSEFEQTMLKLRPSKLGYGLFMLDHAKESEGRGRAVRTSKVVPAMHGQAMKVLAPMADIIAYYGFGEESADSGDLERKMFFQPSETMEAKDRTKGGLPESLVIPEEGGFELVERFLLGMAKPAKKFKKKIKLKRS